MRRLLCLLLFLPLPCWADGVWGHGDSSTAPNLTLEGRDRLGGLYEAPATADIDSVRVYMKADQTSAASDDSVIVCIYEVEADNDTVGIATSNPVVLAQSSNQTKWFVFTFASTPTVTAGHDYFVVAGASASDGTISIAYSTLAGKTCGYDLHTYDGSCQASFGTPGGTYADNDHPYLVYYSTGGEPEPTPSARRRRLLTR